MPAPTLKVPDRLRDLIQRLHPDLKRKVRAALAEILKDHACGKALEDELQGYWSLRVGRSRIIYRPHKGVLEVVAIGPRETIYEETARKILRDQEKS